MALVTKQDEEFNLWLADVEAAVDVGRVVRALRLPAEPPKAPRGSGSGWRRCGG